MSPLPIDVFRTIVRVWMAQQQSIGRPPRFKLKPFGAELGLSAEVINHEIRVAKYRQERINLMLTGGKQIGMGSYGRKFKYVLEDSKIVEY